MLKKKLGIAAATVALAMGMCGTTALAVTNDTAGSGTSWDIPTTTMTNTVEKDGTTYKVITTWANAWATGGPDYLGISNSCYLATQGGGTSSAASYEYAQSSTLMGIWASSANEQPNAYNWNALYNLYANTDEGVAAGAEEADFSTTSNSWDSTSGVWGAFKYRPELIWTSNGLSADSVSTYVGYINDGYYYDGTSTPGTNGYSAGDVDSTDYYIDGDEDYDPYIISANNQNAYSYTDTFYNLSDIVEDVIADYADYTGTSTDWQGMNSLPRTTRYEASAEECALAIEKVTRGSVYYVLSQIDAGTVGKKTVAYLASAPSTDSTTVTVNAYDYIENVGNGTNNGYASFSPLVVDQLITDTDQTVKVSATTSTVGANSSSTNNDAQGSDIYVTQSTATADDLLDCDIIYCANGSMTSSEIEEWLTKNATSNDVAEKIADIQICADTAAIMQWSNYTAEKTVYGAYAVNYFYPELFPNMELVAYWYDDVYHLNTSSVATAMSYALGNADLPESVSLSDLATDYSLSDIEAKFAEGLQYYVENYGTDATISRILAGETVEGSATTDTLSFNGFNPSTTWLAATVDEAAGDADYLTALTDYVKSKCDLTDAEVVNVYASCLEAQIADLSSTNSANSKKIASLEAELDEATTQTITLAKKKVSVKKGATKKVKVKGVKTAIKTKMAKKAKNNLTVTVNNNTDKVVIKAKKNAKKGTYKVKVCAKKSGSISASSWKVIKVKVK